MSPTPIYDDEKEKLGGHDDLGVSPGDRQSEIDDPEDAYNQPDADEPEQQHTLHNPAELARREAEGYGPGALPRRDGSLPQRKEKQALDDKAGGGLYRDEGASNSADTVAGLYNKDDDKRKRGGLKTALFGAGDTLKAKTSSLSSRKKALLFGAGISGTALFGVIAMLIVLFASLKIPNLAAHISSWQMARSARAFRQAVTQSTAEKIALDSSEASAKEAVDKSLASETLEKINKWRPQKTFENLQANGRIKFEYDDGGIIRKPRMTKITIDGTEFPIEKKGFGKQILNRLNPLSAKEDLILSGQIEAQLDKSLHGYNSLVRSSINKKILAEKGVKLFWWEKKGKAFRGASQAQADHLELIERVKRIDEEISAGKKSVVKDLDDAVKDGDEAQKKCVQDKDCWKKFLDPDPNNPTGTADEIARMKNSGEWANNTLSDDARAALTRAAEPSTVMKLTQTLSGAAQGAMIACIIYDGSVASSKESVDTAEDQANTAFYATLAASHQQMSGDTTAEAVGATNRSAGNTSGTIPNIRAANQFQPVPTDSVQSPEASANGSFSMFDLLLPRAITEKLNGAADAACPVLTDWKAGVGLAAVEAALALLGGEAVFEGGAKVTAEKVVQSISESLLTKQGLKNTVRATGEFAASQAKGAATVVGLTVIIKMMVLAKMGNQTSGVVRDTAQGNLADMGGNIAARSLNREMLAGRVLTQPEVGASMAADTAYLSEQKSQQSVYDRYFAFSNPDSLLVNMGVGLSNSLSDKNSLSKLVANSAGRFGTSLLTSGFVGSFNPFKKQLALAQASTNAKDTNYQIVQWGWSEDELGLIQNDPRYFPLENAVRLKNSGQQAAIEKDYNECYTSTMGTLLAEGKIQRDDDGRVRDGADILCSPTNLGRNNPKYGDMVFRWRLDKRNKNVIDHLNDIANPVADEDGSGGGATATLDPSLPQGSKEDLIKMIRDSNNITCGIGLFNTQMKQTILAVIAKLSQKYKMCVASTIRAGGGPHGNGSAVDLGNINGAGVPSGQDYSLQNADADSFAADAATLLPGHSWMGVPNNHYKEIANPIMRAKGGSSDLDTPATTKATGPHFHLNCAPDAP